MKIQYCYWNREENKLEEISKETQESLLKVFQKIKKNMLDRGLP